MLRYTLRQLEYLIACVDTGSLVAAAEALNVSQPSVSSAIAKLEEQLGVQLLIRLHAQGVVPTATAQPHIQQARNLLEHAREFQRTADASQTDISGELRLGSFASLAPTYLPGLIAELGLSYPDIELKISEGTQDQLIAGLRKGDLQVALVYDQELPDDLSRTPLFEARPQVVLPANHSLAGLKKNIAQAYCRGTDDATRYIAKSSLLHQSVYARRAGTSYSLSNLIAGIVAWPGWTWFRLFDTGNQTVGGLDL